MRIPLARSNTYTGRTVLPVVVPPVSPMWAGLHWTRESWPANAEIYLALEYFDPSDKLWHPIVSIWPTPGDVFDRDPATQLFTRLRLEDSIRSAHRMTADRHGPWFHLDRPMPTQMHVIIDTNMQIRTALSVDWN